MDRKSVESISSTSNYSYPSSSKIFPKIEVSYYQATTNPPDESPTNFGINSLAFYKSPLTSIVELYSPFLSNIFT